MEFDIDSIPEGVVNNDHAIIVAPIGYYRIYYRGSVIGEFNLNLDEYGGIYFSSFSIFEELRGLGYSKIFLDKLINFLSGKYKHIRLYCVKSNYIAINLYYSCGFILEFPEQTHEWKLNLIKILI